MMREAIHATLRELGAEVHPMSATGGWFRTNYIARRVGIHRSTARENLRMLLDEGLVELRDESEKGLTHAMGWRAK